MDDINYYDSSALAAANRKLKRQVQNKHEQIQQLKQEKQELASKCLELREQQIDLRALLHAAKCPECDGSGYNARQGDHEGEWIQVQCQWCCETKQLLEKLGGK